MFFWVCLGLALFQHGCDSNAGADIQTETKTQMERLFNLYKAYVETKRKGPPNEQALKEFAKSLSAKELDDFLIGNDLEGIFVSPRDKQPFQIVWGNNLNPAGNMSAVIYEKTGEKGRKYVALSIGYTEEYPDEQASEYIPKKK